VLLSQRNAGEQCAISISKEPMDATKDRDMETYNLALTIPKREMDHEEVPQSLKEAPELMVSRRNG
jgi:bacterioferritin